MKVFRAFRRHTRAPGRTARERLHDTMPGETGALAGLRLGFLVG